MNVATLPEPGAKTLREIHSQPNVWRSVPAALAAADYRRLFAPRPDVLVFTGCGSSLYLAQAAAATFRRVAGIASVAVPSSEVSFFPELAFAPGQRALLVVISRSGETTESLAAVAVARARGVPVLGISCDPASSLPRACDVCILVPNAAEESVVMTRSFTSMLLALQHCAGEVGGDAAYRVALEAVPDLAVRCDYDGIAAIGGDLSWDRAIFLGAAPLYGVAEEAHMKLTEMSLTTANAYRPLEYRHGPMSLADGRTLIVLLASAAARADEAAVAREARGFGARVVLVGPGENDVDAECHIRLPAEAGDYVGTVLAAPAVHLLGYHRAIAKGIDPDEPRQLNRFVALDWRTDAPRAAAQRG